MPALQYDRNSSERAVVNAGTDRLEIVGTTPDCAVATFSHYVLLLWRKQATSQGTSWTRQAMADLCRKMPKQKIGLFTVVEAKCNLETPADVRRSLADLLDEYREDLGAAAIAFEGSGFRMTLVRSVITAVNLLMRSRFPNSVFSDVKTATDWLYRHAGGKPTTPSDLISAIDALRAS